ncbi:hypothetical protein [Bdellovibrio svalbardensis]|uniref:Hydrolase n=1 Tax=Bdellovibrio svalbardensis TaxID=2972972 RepID=A0ABT6DNC6_9BACT|nr:hypothetical protein [Bdellovibrio svalbardensis]MDG0818012.1 hypothetical protein [Bdellovibrio svalbardensis]
MTRLKYALSALLFVFSATAFGEEGYDEWTCREGEMLKGVGLQCISCGVQQYYSDKGQSDVVPSSKWLTLLAVSARQFRELPKISTSNGYGSQETDAMKKVIIAQIQAYGFCTKYISKDTLQLTGGKNYRDLSDPDWKIITPFIKFDHEKSAVNDIAKRFGFKDSTILGFGTDALTNMRDFIDDSHLNNFTVTSKRTNFKNKLNAALSNGYNISGEKIDKKEIIGSGDKDQGLTRCLEEVRQRLNSRDFSNDNVELCGAMAKSCKMDSSFCGGSTNSSRSNNQEYRPSSTSKQLGPPPGTSNRSGGVK